MLFFYFLNLLNLFYYYIFGLLLINIYLSFFYKKYCLIGKKRRKQPNKRKSCILVVTHFRAHFRPIFKQLGSLILPAMFVLDCLCYVKPLPFLMGKRNIKFFLAFGNVSDYKTDTDKICSSSFTNM